MGDARVMSTILYPASTFIYLSEKRQTSSESTIVVFDLRSPIASICETKMASVDYPGVKSQAFPYSLFFKVS